VTPSTRSSNSVGAPCPEEDVNLFATSAGQLVPGAGGLVGTCPVATMTPGNVTGPLVWGTNWYTSVHVMKRMVGRPTDTM
jgi:hypothetical protein